jgi:hypothetical protein
MRMDGVNCLQEGAPSTMSAREIQIVRSGLDLGTVKFYIQLSRLAPNTYLGPIHSNCIFSS